MEDVKTFLSYLLFAALLITNKIFAWDNATQEVLCMLALAGIFYILDEVK